MATFQLRMMALVFAAMAVFLCAGCVSSRTNRAEKAVSTICLAPAQSGQIIDTKTGRVISVRLPDPSIGYVWQLSKAPDRAVLGEARCTACPVSAGWNSVASIQFCFDTVGPGITSLELAYVPQAGGTPIDRFDVTVRVRD